MIFFLVLFFIYSHHHFRYSLSLLQLGAPRGPHGPGLLRGPHHQDHDVAAAHHGDGAQLRAVAAPAQPAAGRHAAVQPEVHIRGEAALRVGNIAAPWSLCVATSRRKVLLTLLYLSSDFFRNDCRIKSRSPPLRIKSTILWGRCRRAGVRSLSLACLTSPTAVPAVEKKHCA